MTISAEIFPPVHYGTLRSREPESDGLALLGVDPSVWPGGSELFAAYASGAQIQFSSKIRLGQSEGSSAIVLEVSTLQVAAFLRIGLLVPEHNEMIARIHERNKVALMTGQGFEDLPVGTLTDEPIGSVLLVELAPPAEFDAWVVEHLG